MNPAAPVTRILISLRSFRCIPSDSRFRRHSTPIALPSPPRQLVKPILDQFRPAKVLFDVTPSVAAHLLGTPWIRKKILHGGSQCLRILGGRDDSRIDTLDD